MANVAEALKSNSPEAKVEATYEELYIPRRHLGLSEVGHKCPRYLWYAHHGQESTPPPGRVLRLFGMGDMIESSAVYDLDLAGYTVTDRQAEVVVADAGITLMGHIDGVIRGITKQPHLLEIKSSNDKRFKELVKLGSYEKWDEKYRAQIHVYMVLKKLKRCLVWVENKNTSEIYTERIAVDKDYAVDVLYKAFTAISGDIPPRICPTAAWFEAKMCKYSQECF
jgi:hypothetical protein